MSDPADLLQFDPAEVVRRAAAAAAAATASSSDATPRTDILDQLEQFFHNGLNHIRLVRSNNSRSTASSIDLTDSEARHADSSGMTAVTPDHDVGGAFAPDGPEDDTDSDKGGEAGDDSVDGSVVNNKRGDTEQYVEFEQRELRDDLCNEGKSSKTEGNDDTKMDDSTVIIDESGANPTPKFEANDKVVVMDFRGHLEGLIKEIRPSIKSSGGGRNRSKYEYYIHFKDWPDPRHDKWLPESDLLVWDADTVAFTKKSGAVPSAKTNKRMRPVKPRDKKDDEAISAPTTQLHGGRRKLQKVASNRRRTRPTTNSREAAAVADNGVGSPRANARETSRDAALVSSVGRTRAWLNSRIHLLKAETYIFAKFAIASIATKNGKVSHLVLNDEWNVLVSNCNDIQEMYVGMGSSLAKTGSLLSLVGARGIPLFHAPKVASKGDNKIYYVGHWAPIQADTRYFGRPKKFLSVGRQMVIRLRYVRYDEKIDAIMSERAVLV